MTSGIQVVKTACTNYISLSKDYPHQTIMLDKQLTPLGSNHLVQLSCEKSVMERDT